MRKPKKPVESQASRPRKKRGKKVRIDPRLKDKLDTYDLRERWKLSRRHILELADGDHPFIRGDWSPGGHFAVTWDEIFRIEGWLQEGRELTPTERWQAMEPPLTPKMYAKDTRKDGPQVEADSVRKAIREERQPGVFYIGTRLYMRAAWVVKLNPNMAVA
jgi:hypothetical protein